MGEVVNLGSTEAPASGSTGLRDQIDRVRRLCSAMELACEGVRANFGPDPLLSGLEELALTLSAEAEKLQAMGELAQGAA